MHSVQKQTNYSGCPSGGSIVERKLHVKKVNSSEQQNNSDWITLLSSMRLILRI